MPSTAQCDAAFAGVRVAVLGASGFIGRWVARRLSAIGAETYLIVRDPSAARAVLADFAVTGKVVQADVTDTSQIGQVLAEIRPAIAFNLVGYGVDRREQDRELARRINADSVRAVAEAVASLPPVDWPGQQLVHAGTGVEYGPCEGSLTEETPTAPATWYGKSKLAGTENLAAVCRQHPGLRAVTARLFTVYGPGEHPGRLLPDLLIAARQRRPVEFTAGHQRRDFTYVEDVVEGLLRLAVTSTRPAEVVNLATGYLASVREFAETAARVLGIPNGCLRFGELQLRDDEVPHPPVSNEKLRQLTGWTPPTTIAEGIRKTAEFTRQRLSPA